MDEEPGRTDSRGGAQDIQQVYLIRRVVAVAVGIVVLLACCGVARWTLGAISAVREQLSAKPQPEPKVQRTKPKPRPPKPKPVVAWQPSHQDDTGEGAWHEYKLAGEIVDAAMAEATATQSVKAWDVDDGLTGSNTAPSNTLAFDKEIATSNAAGAKYFISIHIGTSGESGVQGFFTAGDEQSKLLAQRLVIGVATKSQLPSRGVQASKLYSLEPSKNKAKYRVLIEIGGTQEDRSYLENPENRKLVGAALAGVVNGLD